MADFCEKAVLFFRAIWNFICRFGIWCWRGLCFICISCWRCFCFCCCWCRRRTGRSENDELLPDEQTRSPNPPSLQTRRPRRPLSPSSLRTSGRYSSLINTQDETAESQTSQGQASQRHSEELRKRKINTSAEPYVRETTSVSPPEDLHLSKPTPSNIGRQEPRSRESPIDLEAEQERRKFQATYDSLKKDCKNEENKARAKKAEADQQADWEFEQELERERREDEENLRRTQEEIDEYERETQRILEENREQWKACNDALVKCIRLKNRFEDAEHEWSNWLGTVRRSIDGAKDRFRLFDKIIGNMSKNSSSYERIIKNELNSLHNSTLSAYGRIYEAWTTVKNLAEQQSNRIFLRILQKHFVVVCNKIYKCLLSIDYSMTDIQSLDGIIQSFQQLNSNEIPTTGQLRNESNIAKWEDFNVIDEPHHYSKRTETHF